MINIKALTDFVGLSAHQVEAIERKYAEIRPGKRSLLHMTDNEGRPWVCTVAPKKVELESEGVTISTF